MTTQDIIKMLPIDETRKIQILNRYDSMDQYEKLSIDEMAWSAYFTLYDERLKENVGMQYDKVKNGKEPYGDDFYARALKKTDQEMKGEFEESAATVDLAAARRAMEQIVGEIRAAKADKKAHHATRHHKKA